MTHNGMRNFVLSNLALFSLYFGAASALAVPYFQYPVQVTAYGAKCDGMTDDTAAIQAAVVAAQTVNGGGGTVQFPSGVCVIDLLQGGTGGDSSITLSNVALVGAEVAHNSTSSTITPPGTTISIGSSSTAPYGGMTGTSGTFVPFLLKQSVTIRGINFIYPGEQNSTLSAPISYPSLFSDDGSDQVSNILFDNVHVIAAYAFWNQTSAAPTYGNIRFVSTDVYGINNVFEWSNVQETVTFNNFLSNPSMCEGTCSAAVIDYTETTGVWFHVIGGSGKSVSGLQASNLSVVAYRYGVLVDTNGILNESMFGSATVFDTVPTVLYVNSNGSITHTVFSGKAEYAATSTITPSPAMFLLNNPQKPTGDNNSLSLNGFTVDGAYAWFVYALGTSGNIGSISMVGDVVRHYCDGSGSSALDGVYIDATNTTVPTTVLIAGSQITTANSSCGGLNVTVPSSGQYVAAGDITGYIAGS